MQPINPIDYKNFNIEVFSPDGIFIKEGKINSAGVFYCPGLTPGQKYMVVFSYDNILLLIADFMCDNSGKVVYLSPGHFVFNNSISTIPPKAGNELATKIKRREEFKVPFQLWEKKIIENVSLSGNIKERICPNAHRLVRFKAGAELAKSVK